MSNNNTPFLDAPMNISGAPMPDMNPIQVSAFGNEHAARQTAASAGMYAALGEQATRMQDYKSRAAGMAQLDELQRQSEAEADRGLTAAPGHEDSFYYADGTLNQEKVDDFALRWTEQYEAVRPQFSSREGDFDWEQDRNKYLSNSVQRITGKAISHELSTIRRTSESRIQAAMANDDTGGVYREAQLQVKAGILTQQEADNLTRKASKQQSRRIRSARRSSGRQGARENITSILAAAKRQHDEKARQAQPVEEIAPTEEVEAGADPKNQITIDPWNPTLTQTPLVGSEERTEYTLPTQEDYDDLLYVEDAGLDVLPQGEMMQEIQEDFAIESTPFISTLEASNEIIVPETANSTITKAAVEANAKGGLTTDSYKQAIYDVGSKYAIEDKYQGLSREQTAAAIRRDVKIDGLADYMFDGDEAEAQAFVEEAVSNIVSVYDGSPNPKDKSLTGRNGIQGVNALIAAIPDDDLVPASHGGEGQFASEGANWGYLGFIGGQEWTQQHTNLAQEFEPLKDEFNKGRDEPVENLDDEDDYEDFFKFYMSSKNGYAKKRQAYIDNARAYVRTRVYDSIVDSRRSGKLNWAEERVLSEQVMNQAIKEARNMNFDDGSAWEQYQRKREKELAVKAEAYRASYDSSVASIQRTRELTKAAREQEEQRAKQEEQQARQEERRARQETKMREEREHREANPYLYPVTQKITWDGARDQSAHEMVVTVPVEQYRDIVAQHGGNSGIYATFGNGTRKFIVRPADVNSVQVSAGALQKLFPKLKKGSTLNDVMSGVEMLINFKTF